MRILILIGLTLLAPPLQAASLYKCTDAKGVSSYQQTPCPKETKVAAVRQYQPEPVSAPVEYSSAEYDSTPRQYSTSEYAQVPQQATPQTYAQQPTQSNFEREEAARRAAHNTQLMPRAQANAQRAGRDADRGRVVRTTPPPETQTRQRTDQYGNTYTQPPGSAFATDDKTGKQCFVYGTFVDCK